MDAAGELPAQPCHVEDETTMRPPNVPGTLITGSSDNSKVAPWPLPRRPTRGASGQPFNPFGDMSTTALDTTSTPSLGRKMLNKVPEVTLYFWIIKILCTTVGETAADYLNTNLGFGLTNTTYVTAALLLATLAVQFRARKYLPGLYWLAVVLISVVGTQITDNLVAQGVSLPVTTTLFAIALAGTFATWFAVERSLSIHTIVTSRREGFYWATILFTFALGTAAGDLVAERLALGYWKSALLFVAVIAAVTAAHYFLKLNAILAFWIAYIITRPLGASIGDYLSQPNVQTDPEASKNAVGLGLGTTTTSMIFLSAILALVIYLTVTRKDEIPMVETPAVVAAPGR